MTFSERAVALGAVICLILGAGLVLRDPQESGPPPDVPRIAAVSDLDEPRPDEREATGNKGNRDEEKGEESEDDDKDDDEDDGPSGKDGNGKRRGRD